MSYHLQTGEEEQPTGFKPAWGRAILVVALCVVIGIYGEKILTKYFKNKQ